MSESFIMRTKIIKTSLKIDLWHNRFRKYRFLIAPVFSSGMFSVQYVTKMKHMVQTQHYFERFLVQTYFDGSLSFYLRDCICQAYLNEFSSLQEKYSLVSDLQVFILAGKLVIFSHFSIF